jgi:ABC-type multidrug transport system fused ATPase/permease subunit
MIKNLTDTVLSGQYYAFIELIYLALGLVAVGLLVTYFSKYAITFYKTQTIRDLRNKLTRHIQQLPVSFVDRHHTGDIVSRLNTDVSKIDDLLGRIPDYVYQPLLFSSAFIYIWLINWKLLLAIFVLIPISALVFNKISQPIEKHSKQLREHLAEANALSQDMISGIFITKAFNLQDILSQKYKAIVEQVETTGLYIAKVDASLLFVWLVLRFTPQLVCPLYGGYLVVQGELTAGGLLACITLMWYVFLPIEAFLDLLRQIRETARV